MNSFRLESLSLKYQSVHHQVANIYELENLSLSQNLIFFFRFLLTESLTAKHSDTFGHGNNRGFDRKHSFSQTRVFPSFYCL